MTTHELKTLKEHWEPVFANAKRVELRQDDRGFQVGDQLELREVVPAGDGTSYTGRKCSRIVTHVLRGPTYGMADGWAMLSIRPLTKVEKD